MVFEGTTELYERLYRFNSKLVRKKETYANSEMDHSEKTRAAHPQQEFRGVSPGFFDSAHLIEGR